MPNRSAAIAEARALFERGMAILRDLEADQAGFAEPEKERKMETKKAAGVYGVKYGRLRRWSAKHRLGGREGGRLFVYVDRLEAFLSGRN